MMYKKGLQITDYIAVVLSLYIIYELISDYHDYAEKYFVVNAVVVTSGPAGDDLDVIYDREVRKAFIGNWNVKIKDVDTGLIECEGSGESYYDTSDKVGNVTLSWYVGKKCGLTQGDYLMTTKWLINGRHEVIHTADPFSVY